MIMARADEKLTEKVVNVTRIQRTPDYERNYERNRSAEYTCECCGRKLNPKTMKQVQMLTSAEWTDEQKEVDTNTHEEMEANGQGFFYVGPDCYREIMKQIRTSGETHRVLVIE